MIGDVSEDMMAEYYIWRLVFQGNQSLTEVNQWDLPTIIRANEVLDMKATMEAAYMEAQKPEKPVGGK